MERLVGRRTAISCSCLCLNPSCKRTTYNERWNNISLYYRGIESALEEAKKVANGKDIRIGGGASTIRQCLQAGYMDEMHLVFSPVFLGSGEHLFSGIDIYGLGFHQVQKINGETATHIMVTKK